MGPLAHTIASESRTGDVAAASRIAYLMTEMGCGGAEMQVLALAREMRRRDHEVVVLALQDEEL